MKQKVIIILIVIVVILSSILVYKQVHEALEEGNIKEVYGTITEIKGNTARLQLDNKITGEYLFDIINNDYSKNDLVLVHYKLQRTKVKIKKISKVSSAISNIDNTVGEDLRKQIKVYNQADLVNTIAIPIRVHNENINIKKDSEYLKEYSKAYGNTSIIEGNTIKVELNGGELLSLKHLYEEERSINYTKKDDYIEFISKGNGYYILDVKKDDNIIRIIFV